jgi:hypothetical protein
MMRSANFLLSLGFMFCTVTGMLLILAGILAFPGEPAVLVRDLWQQPFQFNAISPNSIQAMVLTAGLTLHLTGLASLLISLLMKACRYLTAAIFGLDAAKDDSEENWIFI